LTRTEYGARRLLDIAKCVPNRAQARRYTCRCRCGTSALLDRPAEGLPGSLGNSVLGFRAHRGASALG